MSYAGSVRLIQSRSPSPRSPRPPCPEGETWRKAHTRQGKHYDGKCVKKRAKKVPSPKVAYSPSGRVITCPPGMVWRKPHKRTSKSGVVTKVSGKCVAQAGHARAKSPRASPCPPGQYWRGEHTRKGKLIQGKCVNKKGRKSPSPKARKSPKGNCGPNETYREGHWRTLRNGEKRWYEGRCVRAKGMASPKRAKSPAISYTPGGTACPQGKVWRDPYTITFKGGCVKRRGYNTPYGSPVF